MIFTDILDKRGYLQKKTPFSYIYEKGALQVQDDLGYTYSKRFYESKKESASYWICKKKRTDLKCPVHICVEGDFIVKQKHLHNHAPDDPLEETLRNLPPLPPPPPPIEMSLEPIIELHENPVESKKKPNILKRRK